MIEVFNINTIHKGDILASCSVEIKPWRMKIHNILVFQRGVNRWISLPREKFESNGEAKYKDHIEFTDSGSSKRFRDQIMQAVDRYITENGDLQPQDLIVENSIFPF